MNEDALVAELRAIAAVAAPGAVEIGIGDDAAVWQPSRSHRSVITTDALVEDVHFTLSGMTAGDVGYRALASNLSDVAAMGARPVLATIAFGIGPAATPDWILACYREMTELARSARCAIAGGDLVRSPSIVLAITVVGEVRASNCKTRAGMLPGDVLAVTGPLGASRAGLAVVLDHPAFLDDPRAAGALASFRRPEPRLAEGRWLGASRNVRAMMDTSDGLSADLPRLARASGCGVRLETIPVAPAARAAAELIGGDPERWARDGGEDFELLVAVAPRAFSHLAGRFRARFGRDLLPVGHAFAGTGVVDADGQALPRGGWDHVGGENENAPRA